MEVHPPSHALESWRDFFVHIATIVVGLLIAIGLEQSVEWVHHKHALHTAERNLEDELAANRELLKHDQRALNVEEAEFEQDLQVVQARGPAPEGQLRNVRFAWGWDALASTAWNTARDTGAVALMPYETAEGYSSIFAQQDIVDQQVNSLLSDVYRSEAPLLGGRKLSDLTPEERDSMASHLRDALADIQQIRDLCHGLQNLYGSAPHH